MNPILSVAVASYNVEKYLDKCLTSFADERFNDLVQVIIVNDGSTDSTAEIAQRYVDKHPRIFQLINKENGGHGSAVNAGIETARGKYFRIVDGDDWVNTENLYALICHLNDSDADLVVDEKREVNMETGDTEFFKIIDSVQMNYKYEFEEICNISEISPYIMIHTLSIKTEILKSNHIRLLEGIFYVDIEFIIKSTVHAKTIEFLDLEIYQYLVGNVNQSVNYRNYVKRYSHHDQVTKELISFASEYNCSGALRQYLNTRICLLINTHMNISLIYNENRKEGIAQALAFRRYLKEANVGFYRETKKRFIVSICLHLIGVDYERLNRLKRLAK